MRKGLSVLFAGLCVCTLASAEPQRIQAAQAADLLSDLNAWSPWAHREEIKPLFRVESGSGETSSDGALVIKGTGNPHACGCWRRVLPPLLRGRRYRIEAAFQVRDVASIGHSVWAIVTRGSRELWELDHDGPTTSGMYRMSLETVPSGDFENLELRLYLAWSPQGEIRWSDVRLADITDRRELGGLSRRVKLAAVSGRPKNPASPKDCLDFYCKRLDEAGAKGADLVCLPEVINTDGLSGDRSREAEPIPGPSTARLAEKARQYRMYVAASLAERDGIAMHNTGVLIDRAGNLVGKYRKTHLTLGEGLLGGKTPGDSYPVFQTDIGRVGYVICFDNHYPEVARILAVEGAEILVFSNMSDAREGGQLWEPYIRTRALDNQVHIVAAVNSGRSCIVSPRGELLSRVGKTPGAIAIAECDLTMSVRNYSGEPIAKRYLRIRHADTFAPLLREYWEWKRSPDGSTAGPLR